MPEVPLTTRKITIHEKSRSFSEPPQKKFKVAEPPEKKFKVAAKGGVDWSSIAGDVLCSIAEKLDLIEDFVSLSTVCRNWYSFAADFYKKPTFVTPYCMLRSDSDYLSDPNSDPKSEFTFCTYNPKRRNKKIVLELPEAAGRRCWGSPFGWVVTFCPKNLQFSLLHPFSRATLSLPSIETLIINNGEKYNPVKAFLTADPDESPDNCFVLVVVNIVSSSGICGDFVLVFAKPDERDNIRVWTRVDGPNDLSDVVHFEGNLYGVQSDIIYVRARNKRKQRNYNRDPVLFLIQLQPHPRVVELPISPDRMLSRQFSGLDRSYNPAFLANTKRYLVNLNGELCLILRFYIPGMLTDLCRIFKINLATRKWTRVMSLGDQCLFVGNNYTFACKATSTLPVPLPQPLKFEYDSFTCGYLFYTSDYNFAFYQQYGNPTIVRRDVGMFPVLPYRFLPPCARYFTTTYPQLWIVPSLRFRILEEKKDGPAKKMLVMKICKNSKYVS